MESENQQLEDLRRKLEASQIAGTAAEKKTDHLAQAESSDRSWIARRIMSIFTVVIIAALVVFGVQGWRSGDWSVVASEASDLIRSSVLPVVTLILGYYFGRSGRG